MLFSFEFFRYLKPHIQNGRGFPPVKLIFSVGDMVGGATNCSVLACVRIGGDTYSEARMSNGSP